MQAKLEHTTTKFTQYFPDFGVISSDSMYMVVALDTTNYMDGEYTLTIYDDDNRVLAKDIVRIGDYNKNTKVEYKVEKKFIQYVRK